MGESLVRVLYLIARPGRGGPDAKDGKTYMSDRIPAIKVLMLPRDTNPMGTIFGGVILSHLDLAGGVEAANIRVDAS